MSTDLPKLRVMVERVLKEFTSARNSDQWLTIKIWTLYFPSKIIELPSDVPESASIKAVKLTDIMELPREDNVKRIRAIIQNEEHRFLPTSPEVRKQRKINEEIWLEYVKNVTP